MPSEPVAVSPEENPSRLNPWTFVPLLYFMQAIPVSLVQEVATVVYKDLGIDNVAITRWTAIVALPWSLQLLLGPLVDLSGTKRAWVMRCQAVIAAALVVAPFMLKLPGAFALSLGAFLVTAIFSAMGNAAMDGFYLLAMPKDTQARFAGVQTTCYRLGTLFAKGLLVFLAGALLAFPSLSVAPSGGGLSFTKGKETITARSADLKVTAGSLTDLEGNELAPTIRVGPDIRTIAVQSDGRVFGDGQPIGSLALAAGATVSPLQVSAPLSSRNAWAAILLLGGLIYLGMYAVERRTTPRPAEDVPAVESPGELNRNIARTLTVVGMGLSGYFAANALVRLVANAVWAMRDGSPTGPLKGWMLSPDASLLGIPIPGSGWIAETVQLAASAVLFFGFLRAARRSIRGTPMGEAFASYFQQRGIVAILAFLMFYRFGEAMVAKMSPLFLKDSIARGGLGLSTEQVGTIKGVVGVFGIVLGGLAGGWIVSRFGLRKSFLPIAICMHLPNALYLWAALTHPPFQAIYGVDFVEQFGYGFGFAGYMIFQMRVAQRGNYRTAHYALGVGLGALLIQVAGVLSGVLQDNFGYVRFFELSLVLAIPGLLTLLFIPLEETDRT